MSEYIWLFLTLFSLYIAYRAGRADERRHNRNRRKEMIRLGMIK